MKNNTDHLLWWIEPPLLDQNLLAFNKESSIPMILWVNFEPNDFLVIKSDSQDAAAQASQPWVEPS